MCQSCSSDVLKIAQFREMLRSHQLRVPTTMMPGGDLDATLCRYLVARKWDVEKAFQMISVTIKWRTENGIDSYLMRSLPDGKEAIIRRHKPDGHLGVDKLGRPVHYEKSAQADFAAMTAEGDVTVDDFIFSQIRNMEYLVRITLAECTQRAGRLIDGNVVISDFEGAGMNLIAGGNMKVFQQLSSIYSAHYPELMARCYCINTPTIMSILYRALSIFVDAGTKEKIKFVAPRELAAEIDAAILPRAFGGSRSDEDRFLTDKNGFVPVYYNKMDSVISGLQKEADEKSKQHNAETAAATISNITSKQRSGSIDVTADAGFVSVCR